jgi:hypothetical protein
VAEELRFFLRTAAYTAVIGLIYWFLSYEWAGSVMLAFVALATGLVVVACFVVVRATRGPLTGEATGPIRRLGLAIARLVGFAEPRGPAGDEPLAAGLEPIPLSSVWPLVAAAAASMIGLGLVYGPWLTLPGIALAAVTVWGWITQLDARR